jgi:uncharacterized Fe-S cluster protein YjdI
MSDGIKEYSNEDVTVVWEASKCQHAAECVKNAGNVFNPKERPWIKVENGTTAEITNAIDKCPSGALTYGKK